MTLVEAPPLLRSSVLHLQELEDSFLLWAEAPEKPDIVDLGCRSVLMTTMARRLARSSRPLTAAAARQLGMPIGTTIAVAARELLQATIDPDGPRCRSYRAASYFLRGIARLEADLGADPCADLAVQSNGSGHASSNGTSSSHEKEPS
jgi:hypothetical protein